MGDMRLRIVVTVIVAVAAVFLVQTVQEDVRRQEPDQSRPDIGEYGSAHKHLYLRLSVNGNETNFSRERYQLRSDYVHFENGDGEILHVHAEDVTLGLTLQTLDIGTNQTCINVNTTFCTNETHELRFYVNGDVLDDGREYVPEQDDNIWVWYGPRDEEPDTEFFGRELPGVYRPEKPGERI